MAEKAERVSSFRAAIPQVYDFNGAAPHRYSTAGVSTPHILMSKKGTSPIIASWSHPHILMSKKGTSPIIASWSHLSGGVWTFNNMQRFSAAEIGHHYDYVSPLLPLSGYWSVGFYRDPAAHEAMRQTACRVSDDFKRGLPGIMGRPPFIEMSSLIAPEDISLNAIGVGGQGIDLHILRLASKDYALHVLRFDGLRWFRVNARADQSDQPPLSAETVAQRYNYVGPVFRLTTQPTCETDWTAKCLSRVPSDPTAPKGG